MQNKPEIFDRRNNRAFGALRSDDLDLDQREANQRRTTARLPLRLWTEGRTEGRLDYHNCSNISETGMFIETPNPYSLQALVQLEFNLPGLEDPIRVTARVVSRLDDETAGASIMGNGFAFDQIAEADRRLIRSFIGATELE